MQLESIDRCFEIPNTLYFEAVLMNAQRVLFATDFSETSEAAREFATSMALSMKAKMLIVNVVEPPPASMDLGFGGNAAAVVDESQAQAELEKVRPTNFEVEYEHHLLKGTPAHEILKFAKDQDVGLIAMGSHGRRGLLRTLMGSVAESVMRDATCPVATLKIPGEIAVKP
jgi:universal stress protein A